MKNFDPSLYLITDNSMNKKLHILDVVAQAVQGGVTMVQLRAKQMPLHEIKLLGAALLKLLKPKNIPLIVNDYVEIAKEIGADGVHVGAHDTPVQHVRDILGSNFIVGLSVEDLTSFDTSQLHYVDYLAASPVFPTQTKTDTAKPLLLEGLQQLRRLSTLPLVAIGGIHTGNIHSVINAGVDGIAVVSAICGSESPQNAAFELKRIISIHKKQNKKTHVNTLTIAGSDCSGGAGIQADLKTFEALGCYGMSVITALTAQNTQGVQAIFPVSPQHVEEQINSIFEDIHVDAIKIGMLFSKEIIETVARTLKKWNAKNIVVDPVMIAKSGNALLKSDAILALKECLFPLATIVTPNIPEAQALTSACACDNDHDRIILAKQIQEITHSVLIKGGHSEDETIASDLLFTENHEIHWISKARIHTKNTHGTGCTYSAAIAAYLAQNFPLYDAIVAARIYLQGAIQHGANKHIGHGCGPVHHAWKNS